MSVYISFGARGESPGVTLEEDDEAGRGAKQVLSL